MRPRKMKLENTTQRILVVVCRYISTTRGQGETSPYLKRTRVYMERRNFARVLFKVDDKLCVLRGRGLEEMLLYVIRPGKDWLWFRPGDLLAARAVRSAKHFSSWKMIPEGAVRGEVYGTLRDYK